MGKTWWLCGDGGGRGRNGDGGGCGESGDELMVVMRMVEMVAICEDVTMQVQQLIQHKDSTKTTQNSIKNH